MRIVNEVHLPSKPVTPYEFDLNFKLKEIFRNIANKVNFLADGRINAVDNAASSIPTFGMYSVGDIVRNSAPAELGAASSKYVVTGWICTVAGSPGTFLQMRTLTGN